MIGSRPIRPWMRLVCLLALGLGVGSGARAVSAQDVRPTAVRVGQPGWIGIAYDHLRSFELGGRTAVHTDYLVTNVHPDGPAAAAGIQPGDVLLSIKGAGPGDTLFEGISESLHVGDTVRISFRRGPRGAHPARDRDRPARGGGGGDGHAVRRGGGDRLQDGVVRRVGSTRHDHRLRSRPRTSVLLQDRVSGTRDPIPLRGVRGADARDRFADGPDQRDPPGPRAVGAGIPGVGATRHVARIVTRRCGRQRPTAGAAE